MAEKTIKLSTFAWEGTDRRGTKVKGISQAPSATLVKLELRKQGIVPKKVVRKAASRTRRGGSIKAGDIAVLSRQLATMLSAGVPLVQAFDIIGRGHEKARMQDLILAIKADVEAGTALTDALGKHPQYFDALFCNLVQAGEQAGVLDTLLDKIATYKEKTESLKKKIKKALFYPAIVVIVAIAVTAVLLILVVPQFEALFAGFGADLPVFTRMVLDLSEFLRQRWWAFLAGSVLAGYGFVTAKRRSRAFASLVDRLALRLPVVGNILHKAAYARYARTLSTMFAAGVPLVDALESVAGATGNIVYEQAVLSMRDQVASGHQVQLAMKQTDLFPNMMVQMVAIGEEAGTLDSMLAKVAEFYEEEVDNAIDALSSLLEPVIMVVLGVLVGGLVIAMYLPIFRMGQAI